MRSYPAYGRTIAAHVVRGLKPVCVVVLLSKWWNYFDQAPKVCIRPDEWAASRYEFGYLGGLNVVAVPGDDCQDVQLGELLVDLMRAGPALMWAFNADGSKLYDGDDPNAITDWACELMGRRDRYFEIRDGPKRAMLAAQLRSRERWMAQAERIKASAGMEAWTQFYLKSEAVTDRVRDFFGPRARGSGETRAA